MARPPKPKAFGSVPPAPPPRPKAGRTRARVIPEAVAQRMARRIAIATGIPSLMGMAVFVGSYLLVSRGLLDIPPVVTLLASGTCFLLGLLGLSYGVLSASWEDSPGSLIGTEQIVLNIGRLRQSVREMRSG
ncbi:PAM68 family protein [Cyanobium sp. FGCU-6]|nr:PAM68 family protein [Cyanobium sp. FGCU6]